MVRQAQTHTIQELTRDLARLGVTTGDLLMIHASLRAVGPTEAGAEGLIQSLSQAVGDTGTLLMVLGADNASASVNELDESIRAAHLQGTEPFDAQETPADPEVGTLAEVFRQQSTSQVTDHPEGRFAASGFLAAHLLNDPPWDDYFGPGSALERLVDAGGKVVRLGADPDTTTLLHYAEYLAEVPGKRRVRRHRLVSSSDGPIVRVVQCLDDEHGIADYNDGDYFAAILKAFLATGRATTGLVGNASSELILASDLVSFAVEWMNTHLAPDTET